MAQVKTGEGKSTIVAILAIFYAILGHPVHIVSSSRQLSIRDENKYSKLLTMMGLTSSHICVDNPAPARFEADVLYGTSSDFQFAMLWDGVDFQKRLARQGYVLDDGSMRNKIAIVDEIDSMLIDKGAMPAVISDQSDDPYYQLIQPIFTFVNTSTTDSEEKEHATLSEFFAYLRRYGDKELLELAYDVSSQQLSRWIASCVWALSSAQENVDYVVRQLDGAQGGLDGSEIVVVDPDHTGQLETGCRWSQRRHQFVELKHGILPMPEHLVSASMTHVELFRSYETVMGLTGTVGDECERTELREVYNIDTFDVPPYAESRRVVDPSPLILATRALQEEVIVLEVKEKSELGRPCLVLLHSISDTDGLADRLRRLGIIHQLFNGVQSEVEEVIVARAGCSGMITVATNMAGRGTDIVLSSESKARGGLHVVVGFWPSNVRVEAQGFGRAGRQGQEGSARLILSSDDPKIALAGNVKISYADLLAKRTTGVEQQSLARKACAAFGTISHEVMRRYFEFFDLWHNQFSQPGLEIMASAILTELEAEEDGLVNGLPDGLGELLRPGGNALKHAFESAEATRAEEVKQGLFVLKRGMEKWIQKEWGRVFTDITEAQSEMEDVGDDFSNGASLQTFRQETEQQWRKFLAQPAGHLLCQPDIEVVRYARRLVK